MNRSERLRQKKMALKSMGKGKGNRANAKLMDPPLSPNAQNALNAAVQAFSAGDHIRAQGLCNLVLGEAPQHSVAMTLLGASVHQCGNAELGLTLLMQAAKRHPYFYEAQSFLGNALRDQGSLEDAAKAFSCAVKLRPDASDPHINLGHIYNELERFDDAIDHYRLALKLDPSLTPVQANLGDALKKRGRLDEAIECYRRVVEVTPQDAYAHIALGQTLEESGKVDEAISCFQNALVLHPGNSKVHFYLGNIYDKHGWWDAAVTCYQKALSLTPELANIYANLGFALFKLVRLDEAIEILQKGLEIDPEHALTRHNLGIVQMTRGDFAQGWNNYEARLATAEIIRVFDKPRWQGQDLTGKRLAVSCEQGVGDEILYASMLRDFDPSQTELIVECDARLLPIFKRSFDAISFIEKDTSADCPINAEPADYQSPAASLGMYLRPDVKNFTNRQPYLRADPERTQALRAKYQNWSQGRPIIGISWLSKNTALMTRKSIQLEALLPIISNPSYAFISLQYGDVTNQLKAFKDKHGVEIFQDDSIDPLNDMESFAAQVDAVDMVISISNATVHMAGALGKKTWVMLSDIPLWCWQLGRSDSLWYDSVKLFRQEKAGDWGAVIDAVVQELSALNGPADG